jgi:hypothetical protein
MTTLASAASAQSPASDGPETVRTLPPPQPESSSEPEVRTRWYGWQTLAADGASALLFAGAMASDGNSVAQDALAYAALFTYLGASPVIHGAGHRHLDKALGSLTLRVVVPVASGVAAAIVIPCEESYGPYIPCSTAMLAAGILGGAILASGIDAAFLGRERVRSLESAAVRLRMAPLMDATARPAGASLVGTF